MNISIGYNSRLTKSLCLLRPEIVPIKTGMEIDYLDKSSTNTIFICSSVTDPTESLDLIAKINVELPLAISQKFPLAKIVTFGTVLEESKLENAYINSKRELVEAMHSQHGNWHHVRLHTLYGVDLPKEHMFLAEIFQSLKNNTTLKMSQGSQYRQYYDYKEVAEHLVNMNWIDSNKIFSIDSDKPIRLKDLAMGIWKRFNRIDEILFSERTDQNEIFNTNKNGTRIVMKTKDPVDGVHDYLKRILTV